MKEMKNTRDIYELTIWEVIKTAKEKLEEFKIEKEEELEWNLLRATIRFFEDLSKLEVETIKVTIKNKEGIEEFRKNLRKKMELDKKTEIERELYVSNMKKRTKIYDINTIKAELKISKNVANIIKNFINTEEFCEYYCQKIIINSLYIYEIKPNY